MNTLERLKTLLMDLTQKPGLSGNEQPVVRMLRDCLKPLADEVLVDAFGNIIATRYGNSLGPKMMIAAHSDEVGAVITAIQNNGLLSFRAVGVVNPLVFPATRVRVANRFVGTVSSVPGHLSTGNKDNETSPTSLSIDVGAKSEAQVRSWGIQEGSAVVFESPLVAMHDPNLVMGKAIDNRIGCAVLVDVFEQLAGKDLPLTLYGVVNVLEEVGMRGAHMTATRLTPDFAIALDTVPTDESESSHKNEAGFKIGCGPVIQLWEGKAEQFLGTVAHPRVRDLILHAARDEAIQIQLSAAYGNWTTDGAAIHTSGLGIPTGFVSIPRRYAHTPNEILDIKDAVDAERILLSIVLKSGAAFNPDFLADDI
jgi:putative aminopeptidase